MSKPTTKEMLDWLSHVEYLTNNYVRNSYLTNSSVRNSREDDQKFQIIRSLIENSDKGPEVDGKFVEVGANV